MSKSDHPLCLDCWKKQKGSAKKFAASAAAVDGGAKLLSSTKIAEHFGLKAARINAILDELGWVKRAQKGWTATAAGESMMAEQKTHYQSGVPYVVWPSVILHSQIFSDAVAEYQGKDGAQSAANEKPHAPDDFRKKFPANFRATDGHFVRSKAEVLIDNFLYTAGIVHAYERKLPVEEDVYCDFYLPGGKTYIEYWGVENDSKYAARKKQKLEIYAKYNFNLIELGDNEVGSLDDHLPRLLLKFGIVVD